MSYNLIGYQQTAVDELSKKVTKLLQSSHDNTTLVFKAPTGSGKTIMTAKLIEEIIRDNEDDNISFLWVSIGKGNLHIQSKNKLKKVFGEFPPVNLVEEAYFGSKTEISPNEVVVVNWEKIRSKDRSGDWNNTVMKDGELTNFRQVLENTKKKCKIICIIDESHIGADTIRTQELMQIINADVTIEMSATPKLKIELSDFKSGKGDEYEIDPQKVIDAGLIKKDILLNQDIDIVDSEENSQNAILEASYSKRKSLKTLYEAENSIVNPLVLIQIPNGEDGESKKDEVVGWLGEKGITVANKKLQIWLSEEKTNDLDIIDKLDNETEFLIFKQAIDTGWDCPRAQILVKFRETGSQTFEIQTVGRILRMPEQKHYGNEQLNSSYVYTNLQSILIKKEDYNPNILKSLYTQKKDGLQNILLNSYYKQRVDYGDITAKSFYNHLSNVWNEELKLDGITLINDIYDQVEKMGISLNDKDKEDSLILDYQINSVDVDKLKDKTISSDDIKVFKTSENDLSSYFHRYIKLNLNGFAPKRSVSTVESSIYLWFKNTLGIEKRDGGVIKMQKIVLNSGNFDKFNNLLDRAIKSYKPIKLIENEEKSKTSEVFKDITLPENDAFNEKVNEIRTNTKLYFYEKCILQIDRSEQEIAFENYMDNLETKITWWYKNGVGKDSYFGIKYLNENNEASIFYPDYIMLFTDGRIGIFDTKSGSTAKDAKLKAEALQAYIDQYKDKNLFGGIVTNTKTLNDPQFMINNNSIYSYNKNDWSEWKYLYDII